MRQRANQLFFRVRAAMAEEERQRVIKNRGRTVGGGGARAALVADEVEWRHFFVLEVAFQHTKAARQQGMDLGAHDSTCRTSGLSNCKETESIRRLLTQ